MNKDVDELKETSYNIREILDKELEPYPDSLDGKIEYEDRDIGIDGGISVWNRKK